MKFACFYTIVSRKEGVLLAGQNSILLLKNRNIMYPAYVSAILGCMVVTGAARSILAKLFFQLEIADPIFVTLLYLGGQAFSLIPYCL